MNIKNKDNLRQIRIRVQRELLERLLRTLERTANDTLDGRNMADELRALLASHQRGEA